MLTNSTHRIGIVLAALATGTLGSFADDLPRIVWERTPPPHGTCVQFDASGENLITTQPNGTLEYRRVTDLAVVGSHRFLSAQRFAISPDDQSIAAAYPGFSPAGPSYIWLYRADDFSLLWTHRIDASLGAMSFSPDGSLLATGHGWQIAGARIRVWSVADGNQLTELAGPTHDVVDCVFSPDGALVAATDRNMMVRVWNATGGPALWASQGGGSSVRFGLDGRRVVASGAGTRIFDAADGVLLHELDPPIHRTSGLTVSPDGRRAVVADNVFGNATVAPIRAWDIESGALLAEGFEPGFPVSTLAISPDGDRLASGSLRLTLWNALTLEHTLAIDTHLGDVEHLAFTLDGLRILSGSRNGDRSVRAWSASDGSLEWSILPHAETLFGLDVARNGSRFVTIGSTGYPQYLVSAIVANAADGSLVRSIRYPATAVAISPDGETIAVTSAAIRLFRVADGSQIGEFREQTEVPAVAFSPDGALLASAQAGLSGGRVRLKLRRIADGALLWSADGLSDTIDRLAFSADGQFLLAGYSGGAEVRETATGNVLLQQALPGTVTDVAATPANDVVVHVSREYNSPPTTRITIQRITDGAVLRRYESRDNGRAFLSIAIHPLGDTFAVGREDGTVFIAEMPHLPPGDVDRDGVVDLNDLSLLLASFGSCVTDPAYDRRADLDDSDCIDIQDLALLLANFGF